MYSGGGSSGEQLVNVERYGIWGLRMAGAGVQRQPQAARGSQPEAASQRQAARGSQPEAASQRQPASGSQPEAASQRQPAR